MATKSSRRTAIWPWLAGAVVLALLIWGLSTLMGTRRGGVHVDQAVTSPS